MNQSCTRVSQAVVISDAVASPDLIIASTDLVRGALFDAGLESVEYARSIHEATATLSRLQPDLVVLDMTTSLSRR